MPRLLIPTVALLAVALPRHGGADLLSAHSRPRLPRGCGSCHAGHGRPSSQMLPAVEERLCYRCHGGAGERLQERRAGRLDRTEGLRDVGADFRAPFRHPVEWSGLHEPGEQFPERNPRRARHVECVDCHRPHRTVPTRALSSAQITRRSSLDGRSPEYELCYRCHSESVNLPRTSSNIRRRFSPGNPSFHPVETVGRGSHVPSLRAPMTKGAIIACGDCHGNDSGRGMHGSRYEFLLRRHYSSADRVAESPYTYALCYGCHDRRTLLSGRGFSEHARHVRDARISCASCHNAHGSFNNPHLIEFKSTVVRPDSTTGRLAYISQGPGRGQCFLNCHGKNHSGLDYCEPGSADCASGQPDRQQAPLRQRLRGSPFSF